MAIRRVTTYGFSVEPTRAKPVAVASPSTQTRVIGGAIQLDGRGSSVSSGEELLYTWSFVSTPVGSTTVEFTSTESDDSAVTFVPDITGQYTIQLVASTEYRDSDPVTATVSVQVVLVSALVRNTPDADFFFRVLADFWQRIDNKQALSVLWSGYTQVVACDLLRLFQVDYAKSIKDIQSLFQRRWLAYSPRIELSPTTTWGVFGNHQSGSTAFTGSATAMSTGIVISDREVVLMVGAPVLDAVGTDLRIYTGANASESAYVINRLNSDNSGYIVSVDTLFPDPDGDIVIYTTDLQTTKLDNEVSSAGVDFEVLGVVPGDSLRIEEGNDRGYYTIEVVSGASLTVDRDLTSTKSMLTFTVFRAVRVTAQRVVNPLTDTVYIPQDDADIDVFTSSVLSGEAIIQGPYEILVPSRHILEAMVGKAISITSGDNAGRSFTVAAINAAATGFVTSSAFTGTFSTTSIAYEIAALFDVSDRLLVLEGQAYDILSVTLDEDQVSIDKGGRGPLWVITLSEVAVPAGRENLEWRIAGTLISDEFTAEATYDLADIGITSGDKLVLRVTRTDLGRSAELPCQVFGAIGNKLSFDIGTTAVGSGENGALSDAELIEFVDALGVPKVYEDEVSGELQITRLAEVIRQLLVSGSFRAANYNLPVDDTSLIDLGGYFSVRVTAAYVVRNSRILVDDDLLSIPALFEYIVEPEVGEDDDGNIILVARDSTEVELDAEPVTLVENRDFTLGSEGMLSGKGGRTTAGSGFLILLHGDLIDRDVHPGDSIELTSGQNKGVYAILEVTSSTMLRVMTEEGNVPDTTAVGLSWTITRKVSGNFIRFVDGMFTAAVPAPDRLWAETSFFDNSQYIEDNFGVMIGLTKDQFDSYGSTQTSYKGAVSGLMYSWAKGPTLENVAIGAHILTGLPVTEVPGIITAVDPDYTEARGRILIEDINSDGNGIGIVRVYYYNSGQDDVLDELDGLAENIETGAEFAVGDVVPPYTILSKSVNVTDYIETPDWWSVGGLTAGEGRELQKYHTWQITLDASAVDSRDLPLVAQFASAIRPIYTRPEVVLLLYLTDEVQTEDDLSLEGTLHFYDDAAFSLQSTRMVDDYSDSLPLRKFGFGSFSTRTLFTGHDLESVAGSGVVTSLRGGFIEIPTNPPNDYFPDHPMVDPENPLTTENWDSADLPQNLVRVGDILYIYDGRNRGRYTITAVTSDTVLEVARLQDDEGKDYPPRSRAADKFEAATDQTFYIEREDKNPIVTVSIATTAASAVVVVEDGNLIWNGVAVGDEVVIVGGPDKGRHRIVRVDAEEVEVENALEVSTTHADTTIEREVLRTNPILGGNSADISFGINRCRVAGGLKVSGVRKDDVLVFHSASYIGKRYRIVGTAGDRDIWVEQGVVLLHNLGLLIFTIERPHLFTDSDDTDVALEDVGLYDKIEFEVFRPLDLVRTTLVARISGDVLSTTDDLTIAAGAIRVEVMHALTDLTAGGDPVVKYPPSRVMGVFSVSSMAQFSAVLTTEPGNTVLPHRADFYVDEADAFSVDALMVTYMGTVIPISLEDAGVVAGDIFSFEEGDFLICNVTGNVLTLAANTGVAATYTGAVLRRSLS